MAQAQATTPVAEAEQTQAATAEAEAQKTTSKRKKVRRTVAHGHIHVLATFNNTIITVTDNKGNVLAAASAGASGFRGSKKGTAYAAQVASEKAIQTAKQSYGLSKADVFVKGIGLGREAAVRTLINEKVQVDNIYDVTGIPHGGTRPRKSRRT
jgi:small subunit ribosomal protein S11